MRPDEPELATTTSGEWTFVMVDLAGYTALTETHGDEHAADLATAFAGLARSCLADGDRLVKPIGDAVLMAATDPAAGVLLTARLLEEITALEGFPLARAGLNHGSATERDGDMFGAAVNLAARVAGQAAGGQTLATRAVAEVARSAGHEVVALGPFALRNLSGDHDLYELRIGPVRTAGSVDPVCRMWVDHTRAMGRLRHNGSDYWFCSLTCAASFAATPTEHVS